MFDSKRFVRMKDQRLNESTEAAKAALHNEGITRKRMDRVEWIVDGFMGMGLLARLRWVLFGMPRKKESAQ